MLAWRVEEKYLGTPVREIEKTEEWKNLQKLGNLSFRLLYHKREEN